MFRFRSSLSFVIRSLLLALFVLGGLASVASAAGTRWVATGTRALNLGAQLVGRAPAGETLEISAVLPLRNKAEINRLIESREILSPAAVRAQFSPTDATVSAVTSYLPRRASATSACPRIVCWSPGYATVAQAERGVRHHDLQLRAERQGRVREHGRGARPRFARFERGRGARPVRRADERAERRRTPASQSNTGVSLPSLGAGSAAGTPDLSGFTPKALENAYQATTLPPATGTEVAVLTSGNMTPTISDLRKAEKAWRYPVVPVAVHYDGPSADREQQPPDREPRMGSRHADLHDGAQGGQAADRL